MDFITHSSSDEEDIFPGYHYDPSIGLQEDVVQIGKQDKQQLIQELKQIAEQKNVEKEKGLKEEAPRTSIADVQKRIKQSKEEHEKEKQVKRRQQLKLLLKQGRRENEEWKHDKYDKLEKKPRRDLDS
jgi:hypothetical protein